MPSPGRVGMMFPRLLDTLPTSLPIQELLPALAGRFGYILIFWFAIA